MRDATTCGDRWYVAGGVITPAGETRPALWSTVDAAAASGWTPVPIDTVDDYYAIRSILYAIGCRDGRIAIIGAQERRRARQPAGAHLLRRPRDGS